MYILLWMSLTIGQEPVGSAEFNSLAQCEKAARILSSSISSLKTVCLKK